MPGSNIKEKLSQMSDEELYNLINAVCVAAGMDRKKATSLTSDIPRLRRMLSALSDKQIASLVASLGKDDVNYIMNRIGRGSDNG